MFLFQLYYKILLENLNLIQKKTQKSRNMFYTYMLPVLADST